MSDEAPSLEFLSANALSALNHKQRVLYSEFWEEYIEFLRQKGKNPERHEGYSESSIRPRARRLHQVFQYYWRTEANIFELTPELADNYLRLLDEGAITNADGEEYKESSKRKFAHALEAYFRFEGKEWDPAIEFGDNHPSLSSDPFRLDERRRLLEAALEYHTPPTYSNVSPEERDRWNAHIAQTLGKPKDDVTPSDWEELRHSWKIPSLISTALDIGARAKLVRRLDEDHAILNDNLIIIPPEVAVKNDSRWENVLSDNTVTMLERWIEQRANKTKYDDSDALWLNRKGNRYSSANLNDLLRNLMEEAGINPNGRRLTWHSIRHTTGTYIYENTKDLGYVAEILRHQSLEAARRYAHPTPESKREVIESIQGGGVF